MGTDTAFWQTILSNEARHLHASGLVQFHRRLQLRPKGACSARHSASAPP